MILKTLKQLSALSILIGSFSFAAGANAASIVPTTEGEIQLTNLTCLGGSVTCINTTTQSIPYQVTSLNYDTNTTPQYGLSRLFSDGSGTANNWGFGINFDATDIGTNAPVGEYVFRPVAYNTGGTPIEKGQLEVGKFSFDFLGKTVNQIQLDFFDTESNGTGVTEINGAAVSQQITPGANNNLQTITLNNVSSFTVQLGNAYENDGVDLAVTVPEPTNIIGLAGIAIVGGLQLRKKRLVKKSA